MKLVVYTAITGGFKDVLRPPTVVPAFAAEGDDVRFVCFSDRDLKGGGPYVVRDLAWEHPNEPRRSARWHKVNAHVLFPDADFTVWHDGSHQLVTDPRRLAQYLAGDEFGAFKHPDRDCVYDELRACVRLRKDDPTLMREQVERYRRAKFPKRHGLFETGCVVRANTPAVAALNAAWWSEIAQGSCRDQLALPYALWRTGFRRTCHVPGSGHRSEFFDFKAHR